MTRMGLMKEFRRYCKEEKLTRKKRICENGRRERRGFQVRETKKKVKGSGQCKKRRIGKGRECEIEKKRDRKRRQTGRAFIEQGRRGKKHKKRTLTEGET